MVKIWFKKLVRKLEEKWASKISAQRIAAYVGVKKYWKAWMAKKAAAWRKAAK